MRELSRSARAYISLCYLLGAAAAGWLAHGRGEPATLQTALLAVVLAVLASAAQLLVVARSNTHYSDHLTPAPIFAAVLMLPPWLLALVVVATFIPEWIRFGRKWFIQLFNIASWMFAAALARGTLLAAAGSNSLGSGATPSAAVILLAAGVFLCVQTAQLAEVLHLARGESFARNPLFHPTKLLSDFALLCAGWMFAAAWAVRPAYSLAAAVPLIVYVQALQVPNLREEADTDPKTGLANMRAFGAAFNRQLEQAVRTSRPSSLLMCDLDELRRINNTHGHQVGDLALQSLADVIRHSIRACDLAARFGGEEFIVYLEDTDRACAAEVAEQIRARLAETKIPLPGQASLRATVSIGVAAMPEDGLTAEDLTHEADVALYEAKRSGRNQVCRAGRTNHAVLGTPVEDGAAEAEPSPPKVLIPRGPLGRKSAAARPAPAAALPAGGSAAWVQAVVAAVLAASLVTGGLAVWQQLQAQPLSVSHLQGLGLLAVLVVLAEQFAVDIDGRGKTSVSAAVMMAATFLYGAVGALATAAVFAAWAKARAGSPIHRMLFNFGAIALAALASGAVLQVGLGGPLTTAHPPVVVPIAMLAGLTYYTVNHVLLSLVRGVAEGRSSQEVWATHYRWLWPHYTAFGVLGWILGVGFLMLGWVGLLALMVPLGMMHLAIKQYMDHTGVYVNELKWMNEQLSNSYEATLEALSRALDTRDEETEEHSIRVQRYAELVARRHGIADEQVDHIVRGALLHDIGKIGVPDAILLKQGELTAQETELMQRHPVIGYAMIAHIPFLAQAAQIVLHHHEAYDGTGYPRQLRGEQIPLGARIFAVVDALDAMTSDRPYRPRLTTDEALAEIGRCRGTQFDPAIVDTMLGIPRDELLKMGDTPELRRSWVAQVLPGRRQRLTA